MDPRLKRRRGHTRLSTRNQVTLPVAVIVGLGLHPGQRFRVEQRGSDIVLVPEEDTAAQRRRVIDGIGDRFAGMYGPGYLGDLRAEWD